MPAFSIRLAAESDLETLAQGNIAMALETEALALDAQRVRDGVAHLLTHPELGHYLLAESDSKVVGQCMITTEWSDWRCAPIWWFQSVYVWPQARRTGVFSALHREVVKQAKIAHVAELRLYVEHDNHTAQATYQALGLERGHYQMHQQPLTKG